ncbi:hypothetical protein MMC14_010810 [Varicellaria rhodocarpa]|nr:hypothetical protein [Varicellaria rhodocarpa]
MPNSSESTSTPPITTPQSVPPSTDLHTSYDHDDSAAYQYGGDGKILGGTKLSFDNYVLWFKSLKFWAESRDCEWVYEYNSESVALRADTNPTRKRSRKRWNAKLMTMILAGVDEDDQGSIEDLDQACEAIKMLKERYYGNAKRPVIAERHLQEYFNYKLTGTESIEQAWSKLKSLARKIVDANPEMKELKSEPKIYNRLLAALPEQYSVIRDTQASNTTWQSTQQKLSVLKDKESQLNATKSESESANYTNHSTYRNRASSSRRSSFDSNRLNRSSHCRKPRPRHRQGSSSSSSSSSSNRSNGSAVICYLCDGDHLIHFCPHLAGAKKAIRKEKDHKHNGKGKGKQKDPESSDSGESKSRKSKHVSFEKLPSTNRKSSKRSHSHTHSASKYDDDEIDEAAHIAIMNGACDSDSTGSEVYAGSGSSNDSTSPPSAKRRRSRSRASAKSVSSVESEFSPIWQLAIDRSKDKAATIEQARLAKETHAGPGIGPFII